MSSRRRRGSPASGGSRRLFPGNPPARSDDPPARSDDPPARSGRSWTNATKGQHGLEAESLPGELTEDIAEPPDFRLGPTPVSEVNFLMDYLRLREPLLGDTGIRSFGWVEGGYSGHRRVREFSPCNHV